MKIAVQKNHLGGQIWYRSLDHVKKTASIQKLSILIEISIFEKKIRFLIKNKIDLLQKFRFFW